MAFGDSFLKKTGIILVASIAMTAGFWLASELKAPEGGSIQLQGTVRGREFLGSNIRYRVNVNSRDMFADVSHQQGRQLLENGTTVNLGIPQNQIKIVSD